MSEQLKLSDLRVVRGGGTDEEHSAARATLHAAIFEAADHGIADESEQDGWSASQRAIRTPLSIAAAWTPRRPTV